MVADFVELQAFIFISPMINHDIFKTMIIHFNLILVNLRIVNLFNC